jgi:DNA adenine methylase
MSKSIGVRPFLKWAGGKYRIVNDIKKFLPTGNRLIEPFVGSGAVFLNTNYDSYLLADINGDLINVYYALKEYGREFIEFTRSFFTPENNTKEKYLELRDIFNDVDDIFLKPALFIYLNRHCYNGLIRYNQKGQFNTPFGKYKNVYFPEKEMLMFYNKLKASNVELKVVSYEELLKESVKGDVIYCDPPYIPLSKTANFTQYHQSKFTMSDQLNLIQILKDLASKGIPSVLSNHYSDLIVEYIDKYEIVEVRRSISCKERECVKEIIAFFGSNTTSEKRLINDD